uniref:SET domain-containing protein n=1 Tax=Timema poppense TaxID=170557 RepID=A0A7R9D583_TIMPO|nr:unnamed protein product [Timema poppensis]
MLAQEMSHLKSSLQSRDQGKFAVCASHHVYHLNCAMMVLGSFACLHCGQDPLDRFMVIDVHAGKSPIFFPHPQVPKKRPSAKMCFGGSHTTHTKPDEVPLTESIALTSESVTEMPETFTTDLEKEKLANFLSVASSMLTNPVPAHSRPLYLSYAHSQTAPTTLSTAWIAPHFMFSKPSMTSSPLYSVPMGTPLSFGSLGGSTATHVAGTSFCFTVTHVAGTSFSSTATHIAGTFFSSTATHVAGTFFSSTATHVAGTFFSSTATNVAGTSFCFTVTHIAGTSFSSTTHVAGTFFCSTTTHIAGTSSSPPPPLSLDSSLQPVLSSQSSSPSLTIPANRSSPSSQSPTSSLELHNFQSPSFTLTSFQPYNFLYTAKSLYSAAKNGNTEKLISVLATGLNPNILFRECLMGSVLHLSSSSGHLSVVQILVQAGAQLDVLDRAQNTPLMLAVLEGKNEVVNFLIKAGASVMLKGMGGMTALHLATKSGNQQACQHILAIPNLPRDFIDTKDDGGWTPLVWAAEHSHAHIVEREIHGIYSSPTASLVLTELWTVNLTVQPKALVYSPDLMKLSVTVKAFWEILVLVHSFTENKDYEAVLSVAHWRYLLSKRANPFVRDAEQNIALHWSAFSGCAEITELLLNLGSDPNSTNLYGDTPLHIGARQNMYECVHLLLARRARLDLKNTAGELALDCCVSESSECFKAISLNIMLRDIVVKTLEPTVHILSNDISHGKEVNPVQCINWEDDEGEPTDYVYVSSNCFTSYISIDQTITSLQSCRCTDGCTSTDCRCNTISLGCPYDNMGRLVPDFNYAGGGDLPKAETIRSVWIPEVNQRQEDNIKDNVKNQQVAILCDETTDRKEQCVFVILLKTYVLIRSKAYAPMVFECNQMCACNRNRCVNRVMQKSVTEHVQLFRTRSKGWGVRILRPIPKGTYVCEYIGDIVHDVDRYIGEAITDVEADHREDDSYLFDLDNKDGETYCIDARHYGNVSRFINHMCVPNLIPVKVFVDHHDLHFPRIAFFSNRDIDTYEELGFDYGEKFWIIKSKSFTCECGADNCRYSKTTITQTLENYLNRLQEMDRT